MSAQEELIKLRTLVQQNGALVKQQEGFIAAINSLEEKMGDIQLPEIDFTGVAQESTLQEIKNTLGVVDDKTFMAMTDEEIIAELTDIWNTMV